MTPEPVCYVVPGQETVLAKHMGGTYNLESCGFFNNCDDVLRSYQEGPGGWDYIEIWKCSPDPIKSSVIAVVSLIILCVFAYILWKFNKKKRNFDEDDDSDIPDLISIA